MVDSSEELLTKGEKEGSVGGQVLLWVEHLDNFYLKHSLKVLFRRLEKY